MAGFNIANFNLYNFAKRFWDMFGNPTPMDVEVPQKNPNGDIETYLCPNLAKFKKRVWDDVGGALGQFNRTFYVDGINGSDTNDGTLSNPFKTIMKAINSSPIGARVSIYLMGSSDVNNRVIYSFGNSNSSNVENGVKNKTIFISSYGGSYSKIKPDVHKTSTTNYVKGLTLDNSFVWINTASEFVIVEGGDIDTSLGIAWTQAGVFNYYTSNSAVSIGEYPTEKGIYCLAGQSSIINICSRDTNNVFGSVLFRHTKIVQDINNPNKAINIYGALPTAISLYSVQVLDQDGNVITPNDIVSGITLDVDSGNPINVVSNVNFSS